MDNNLYFQMSRYKMCHLYDQIRTPDSQIAFLQKHDIFNTSHLCPDCDIVSTTVKNRAGSMYHYFECEKCHKQTSIRKNTVLYKKGISLRSFLMIAYIFVMLNYTHEQIIHEVDLSGDEEEEPGEGPSLSCNTTVYYNNLLRCNNCSFDSKMTNIPQEHDSRGHVQQQPGLPDQGSGAHSGGG